MPWKLFGPVPFAKSAWLPSLGDVFVNTILILFLIVQFNRDFTFPRWFYDPEKVRIIQ